MRFPTYPKTEYKSPPISVVDSYVDFVGQSEIDDRRLIDSLPTTDPLQVAARIGRGCLIAARGNELAARKIFRRAQRDLEPQTKLPMANRGEGGRRAVQLFSTAQMLEFHGDGTAVAEARHDMHLATVADIEHLLDRMAGIDHSRPSRLAREYRGELIEKIGMGILGRFSAHPWLMSLQSLTHHDQARGRLCHGNYDMLVVETSAEREFTQSHKIQVKAACLGLCSEPQDNQVNRAQYSSDVFFMSGCCDLGIRDIGYAPGQYHLGELLIKEAADSASPVELKELDLATSSLMLALTMDAPARQGTYQTFSVAA